MTLDNELPELLKLPPLERAERLAGLGERLLERLVEDQSAPMIDLAHAWADVSLDCAFEIGSSKATEIVGAPQEWKLHELGKKLRPILAANGRTMPLWKAAHLDGDLAEAEKLAGLDRTDALVSLGKRILGHLRITRTAELLDVARRWSDASLRSRDELGGTRALESVDSHHDGSLSEIGTTLNAILESPGRADAADPDQH